MNEANTRFSPGGRFENSPAVHCRVQRRYPARPEGTDEFFECYGSIRNPFLAAEFQPSLRDWMSLFDKPTLSRVGYFQISLREMAAASSALAPKRELELPE
jgi:hypothetical protein